MPSSMQMSRTLAPFSTCCRATLTACSYLPSLISLANFGDPATLVRSPITMYTPGCWVKGCDPDRRRSFVSVASATLTLSSKLSLRPCSGGVGSHSKIRPPLSRRQAFERFGDGRNVLRCVTAATAGNIDQSSPCEIAQIASHVLRPQIESGFRQGVGQTCIRIARDRHV